MKEERMEILKMLQDGIVSPEEAERLLSAMDTGEQNNRARKDSEKKPKVKVFVRKLEDLEDIENHLADLEDLEDLEEDLEDMIDTDALRASLADKDPSLSDEAINEAIDELIKRKLKDVRTARQQQKRAERMDEKARRIDAQARIIEERIRRAVPTPDELEEMIEPLKNIDFSKYAEMGKNIGKRVKTIIKDKGWDDMVGFHMDMSDLTDEMSDMCNVEGHESDYPISEMEANGTETSATHFDAQSGIKKIIIQNLVKVGNPQSGTDIELERNVDDQIELDLNGDKSRGFLYDEDKLVVFTDDDARVRIPSFIEKVKIKIFNGDISGEEIPCSVYAKTLNGDISFDSSTPVVTAQTLNGDISVVLAPSPEEKCKLSTHNGDIELTIPEDLACEIKAKTVTGEIDFEDLDDLGETSYRKKPGKAMLEAKPNRGGDYDIKCKTLNGDIAICSAETDEEDGEDEEDADADAE